MYFTVTHPSASALRWRSAIIFHDFGDQNVSTKMEDCRCWLNCILHLYENTYFYLKYNTESCVVEAVFTEG